MRLSLLGQVALLVLMGIMVWSGWPPALQADPQAPFTGVAKYDKRFLPPVSAVPGDLLDCASAPTYTIGDDQVVTTVTEQTSGGSQTNNYGCVAWPENGNEYIFLVDATTTLNLHTILTGNVDLDLFILDACHSDSCLAAINREAVTQLTAGSYVLVVDSNVGGNQPFTLTLAGFPSGLPLAACDAAKPLACLDASAGITGNVHQQDDFMDYAPCAPILEFGTERWHSLNLDSGNSLEVSLDMPQADSALWLFQDCGSQATCVAFSDLYSTGGVETMTYVNDTGQDRTYYLGVDTFRHVSQDSSAFTLNVSCPGGPVAEQVPATIAELAETIVCTSDTVLHSNLFNQPDLLSTASCGGFATLGGERWYALILPDDANIEVDLDGMLFDGALWLFDGCGPDAQCIAFSDDLYEWGNPLGHAEKLSANKSSGGGHTYYLAVDTVRDTSTQYEAFWDFELTISCNSKSIQGKSSWRDALGIFR